ncbi:hypothetical protein QCA50_012514 [Cerrena zonata]|uniref:Uncharacterized protein n=1 Tax=Cerrena zonata TaxID=2478898 RepID=A0AAW0G4S4_9APHY
MGTGGYLVCRYKGCYFADNAYPEEPGAYVTEGASTFRKLIKFTKNDLQALQIHLRSLGLLLEASNFLMDTVVAYPPIDFGTHLDIVRHNGISRTFTHMFSYPTLTHGS